MLLVSKQKHHKIGSFPAMAIYLISLILILHYIKNKPVGDWFAR